MELLSLKRINYFSKIINHSLVQDLKIVIPPFFLSRLLIILIGFFSYYFQASPDYPLPESALRGYDWTSIRMLDMFERYDSGWYLTIVRGGYYLNGEIGKVQSNITFYPLYPFLVRLISGLKPGAGNTFILFCGIFISNFFFLFSLALLQALSRGLKLDQTIGGRAAWYLCFFPSSFIFSSFFTESLFLFLSIAVFYSSIKEKWWLAGLCGYLAVLTRVNGLFTAVCMLVIYLEKINWDFRQIRWSICWIGLIPLGNLTFLIGLLPITGNLFAPFAAQSAWSHSLVFPWVTLFTPLITRLFINTLDQILAILFLVLSVYSLFKLPSKSFGVYCLLSIGAFLFTGTLLSTSRYLLVLFPIFLVLGFCGKNQIVDRTILVLSAAFLAVLMTAWVRFYWVV